MLVGHRSIKKRKTPNTACIMVFSAMLLASGMTNASVVHFVDTVTIGDKEIYTPTMTVVTPDGTRFFVSAVEAIGTKGVVFMLERKKDDITKTLAAKPNPPKIVATNGIGVVGMDQPQALVISADAKHLYVASRNSDGRHGVVAFKIEPQGTLTFLQAMLNGTSVDGGKKIEGLNKIKRIALSSDGKHLYATSDDIDGAIAVFARNVDASAAGFGKLSFTEIIKNNVNGVGDLRGAYDVAFVSGLTQPLVYVTAPRSGELQVFERNTADGALTQLKNNPAGPAAGAVSERIGYSALVESKTPAGLNGTDFIYPPFLYAARASDKSIVSYAVDTLTGELKPGRAFENGKSGIDGLGGIMELAFSSDGTKLIATSVNASSLVLFRRNPLSGELRYIETLRDGEYGVDGLIRSGAISVVSDAPYIYTTASGEDLIPGEKKMGIFRLAEADIDLKVRRLGESNIAAGQNVEFTVEVNNAGDIDASHVAVAFTATSTFEYVDATIKNGVCSATDAVITCEIGGIGPNQSVSFQIKVTPNIVGSADVNAIVFADQLDSKIDDNISRLSLKVGPAQAMVTPTSVVANNNDKSWFGAITPVQLIALFLLALVRIARRYP